MSPANLKTDERPSNEGHLKKVKAFFSSEALECNPGIRYA